jgi:heptosyltransferase-2
MESIGANPPRKILVRAVNWLGDAVLTTPALQAVREAFPSAHITIAARPLVAELFRNHPDVDEIVVYDNKGAHSGLSGMLRVAGSLRRLEFEAAILFQNAFDAALLSFLARVPQRMGYATDGRRVLLTRAVPVTEDILRLHHAEYYLRLVSELGIPRPATPALRLKVSDEEKNFMSERLAELGIPKGAPILGINPGATYGSAKRWFPDRFAAVADALSEEWGAFAVLMGSPPERALACDVENSMRGKVVNLAGRTTVRELMALLSGCSFLVTNDSGPMHIGAALGIPMVAIFGPTDWRTTSPWTRRARIVRAEVDCSPCLLRECNRAHECMFGVTPDMVIGGARSLVAEISNAIT